MTRQAEKNARHATQSGGCTLRPLDDKIVVRPAEAETASAGGILLPETSRDIPQRGTVLAIGPGRWLRKDSGAERAPVNIAVGDTVLYSRYAGTDVEEGGTKLKIMSEQDVLAVVS